MLTRPDMRVGERSIDGRLMRRYSIADGVEVDWVTGARKTGLRRTEVVPKAQVLDLLMGGMLVEVPAKPRLEVGAIVQLASDGNTATARVAHKHVALDPAKQLLGIEFVEMSEDFEDHLHRAITAIRG